MTVNIIIYFFIHPYFTYIQQNYKDWIFIIIDVDKMTNQAYHTVGIIHECSRKNVETEVKSVPLRYKYMTAKSVKITDIDDMFPQNIICGKICLV